MGNLVPRDVEADVGGVFDQGRPRGETPPRRRLRPTRSETVPLSQFLLFQYVRGPIILTLEPSNILVSHPLLL